MSEKEIDTSKKVTITQIKTDTGKKYAITGNVDWTKLQWTFNNI